MYFKQCLLSVILALCLAGICDAIKCYECQSSIDPQHCGEKFSESNQIRQIDCSDRAKPPGFPNALIPTKCSKTIIEDRNGKVVIRGCHYQNPGTVSQCSIDSGPSTPILCETCTGDLCNGASHHYVTLGTVFLVLTSAIFML